jgi:curved DNA-binding protein CbpA
MQTATLEHYRILGVNFGAGFADITASYKKLCRAHHPDINDDPDSEELMKNINIAYMVLRDKFMRETLIGNRQIPMRPVRARRYSNPDLNTYTPKVSTPSPERAQSEAEAQIDAYTVIHDYFTAINGCDYIAAYNYLSSYDKSHISIECFVQWRESVARLYPMREFKISGGLTPATIKFKDNSSLIARKFNVVVTEDDFTDDSIYEGVIEKLVTRERSGWRVFLGYKSVRELTRRFNERLEAKRKRDINKLWEEYYTEQCPDYNMYNIPGMKKIVTRETYRQRRYGGVLSFAVISVAPGGFKKTGNEALLRSAAKSIASSLRDTDVPAYAGDGVFMILMIELKKKSTQEVLRRLIEKIRRKAGPQLGTKADINYAVETWTSETPADIEAINDILIKFGKKM